MASTKRVVKLGWQDASETPFVVRARVTFGTPSPATFAPSSRWVPGDEDDAVEVLSVTEDKQGGVERPELVEVAQKAFDQGEVLHVAALELASDDGEEPDDDDLGDFYADESLCAAREREV